MDPALIVALIALAGSIFSTAATLVGAPALQARREARTVLERHRDPLLAAAYELQARLHNILCNRFTEDYVLGNKAGKQEAALESTLYVFAQFFGWREIIRREIQFLRFLKDEETREVAQLLRDVGEAFLTDEYGPQFMIWRVEQRGLGRQADVHGLRELRGTPRDDEGMARPARARSEADEQGWPRAFDEAPAPAARACPEARRGPDALPVLARKGITPTCKLTPCR